MNIVCTVVVLLKSTILIKEQQQKLFAVCMLCLWWFGGAVDFSSVASHFASIDFSPAVDFLLLLFLIVWL